VVEPVKSNVMAWAGIAAKTDAVAPTAASLRPFLKEVIDLN
jgi:hypothetical protein